MRQAKKVPFKPVILVCGLSGSGKSELVDSLGKALKLDVVHTSGVFRMLREKSIKAIQGSAGKKNQGWWESAEGKAFAKERTNNAALDRELDQVLLKRITKQNVIMDSWTMPWLYKGPALRLWLDGTISTRATRLANRNHQSFVQALQAIQEKEFGNTKLYYDLYGFDIQKDRHIFDAVINTEHYTQEEVFQLALAYVKEWMKIAKKK